MLISLPTYPDYAAVQRAKEEQSESVELLKKTGVQEFDLPVHWLPVDNGGEQVTTAALERMRAETPKCATVVVVATMMAGETK